MTPVLLFDGECVVCNRLVQFVLRVDRHGTLLFASLQGKFAGAMQVRHPELRNVDSVAWVEPSNGSELVLVRSEAVLRLARYLGFPWRMLGLAILVPRPIRDRLYDWFAARRHRWFGRAVTCSLPTTEHRNRMVS
jgi:predicted DCC family thiol-disulfide oxidoreductase YuxK